MGKMSIAKECAEITLVRPGLDPQAITLPVGATLADFLREAGVGISSHTIMIDGRPIEDVMVLKAGSVITLLPGIPLSPSNHSRRATVGMFADDHDFDEMVEAGRAIREADRKATLEAMDREDAARDEAAPEVT